MEKHPKEANDLMIGRLRELMEAGGVSQAEFARRLGMDPSNMSKIMCGKMPVSKALVNRLVVDMNVNKQWFITGMGEVYQDEVVPQCEGRRAVPVYDIDFTAGALELTMPFSNERVAGFINLPEVSEGCVVVRVSGDSMLPTIGNGAYVALRPISPNESPIYWGQIYGVVLEEYRMVKYVRRNANPDMVTLHSDNPAYDDMEVPKSAIRGLFLVETVLNLNRRY